ncbi:MAG: S-methyl-5'-thioadenosine phosphorylase [Thermoprotei archaeon]|nr:MAG: S-methyl-5'-thioadenosine phosphorylase [Thermoprotei archaeon]
MAPLRLGIIAGSGLEKLLEGVREKIGTPYGSIEASMVKLGEEEALLVPRHGFNHSVPPHKVNYRANLYAMYLKGVARVIALSAVGSLREHIKPGQFVVVDDLLDFTKSRPTTFYEGPRVVHVDMTNPYCPEIRTALVEACRRLGVDVHVGGVYVCTEGPRFETPAEIRMFRMLGGDVVGMTGVPEVQLARELKLCYATLCVVTNMAAGMQERVTVEEVERVMSRTRPLVLKVLLEASKLIPNERRCSCRGG